ncbi:MAG: FG-GAP repeat protein [Desulfobulbaceae bacterium]|nr:FG-GAP repeat protein [Desulfobulbaceae bacterium]
MKPSQLFLCLTLLCIGLATSAGAIYSEKNLKSAIKAPTSASIEDIPLSARYAISTAIGLDQKSYHGVGDGNKILLNNPAQRYLVNFAGKGLEVQRGGHRFDMTLQAYGYGNDLLEVQPALPEQSNNRVTYRRGPLKEWYVNGPYGLQQGFTLDSPPATGKSEQELLTILLSMNGGLLADIDPDGLGMNLTAADGNTILRYSGLTVVDADGKQCGAWLETQADILAIRVNDDHARYPLTIDPVFQTAKLTTDDPANMVTDIFFGSSIAISGDTMVVGAPRYDTDGREKRGSAYVFIRQANGFSEWGKVLKLKASDGRAGDQFGNDVAISGDTVVVGAFSHAISDKQAQGAAYVFVKPVTGWTSMTQTGKLTAGDGAAQDYFGSSVAIDGNLILVGARGHDTGGNAAQGAAYVFVKPGSGWANATQTSKLTASDGAAGDGFGRSVALSGYVAVVGAYQFTSNGPGAAYVFVEPGSGWADATQTSKLTADDGANGDQLGNSVAIRGDTVVAGAPKNDAQGAAYVFVKPGAGWSDMTQTAKLTTTGGAADDLFGYSVGVSGDTVVVGAWGHDTAGNQFQGTAYIYAKPISGWVFMNIPTAILSPDNGAEGDRFGAAVAIDGDTAVAGAYSQGTGDQGAAYVFDKPVTGWTTTTGQSAELSALNEDLFPPPYFGQAIAMGGDTVIVGAPYRASSGNFSQGAAYIFVKNGASWNNMTQSVKLLASGGAAGDQFGWSVAISGDTAVVGAPYHKVDVNDWEGAAYIFVKPAAGWQSGGDSIYQTAMLRAGDGAAGDRFGKSVAISTDTVVVGSPQGSGLSVDEGAVYVFIKPALNWSDMSHTAKLIAGDGAETDSFGEAVAISNDTIVVGAPRHTISANQFQGAAYVFVEPAAGWSSVSGDMVHDAQLTSNDGATEDDFGNAVAINGEVVVAGAWHHDIGASQNQGAAYVYTKPPGGWSALLTQNSKLFASDGNQSDSFGFAVTTNGNVIAVGSPFSGENVLYLYGRADTDWTSVSGSMSQTGVQKVNEQAYGLGISAAISGDTLVSGTLGDSAYLFTDVGILFPWTMFLPAITNPGN